MNRYFLSAVIFIAIASIVVIDSKNANQAKGRAEAYANYTGVPMVVVFEKNNYRVYPKNSGNYNPVWVVYSFTPKKDFEIK